MAAAVAAQLATSPVRLLADCQSVVGAIQKWVHAKVWGSKMHDGFVRFIATEQMAAPFAEICKINAHRASSAAANEKEAKESPLGCCSNEKQ